MTLPVSTPEAQGVDPAAVRALVEAWETQGTRPFALTIVRHGHVVARTTWAPYEPTDLVQKYSLSKTFTASAVGLAVAEGRFAVTDTAASFFPELTDLGPRARAVTVANLLSMASGHTHDIDRFDPADPVGSFLRTEPEQEPGSVFQYNQGCTLTLSAIVQRVTGEPLHTYLRPRLFDPLGIGDVAWIRVGEVDMGYAGLHVTCDAVAALGTMLLQGGRFGEHQVLPAAWVRDAMTVHIPTAEPNEDWRRGYGYQMWRSRHGWRGDGAFGQLCLVMPEQDLVVAACAQTEDMQSELDAVWAHLVPGLHDAALADGDGRAADDVLGSRSLPTLAATTTAPAGRHVLRATGEAARYLAVGGEVVVEGTTLVLDDGELTTTVELGDGVWLRSGTPGGRPGPIAATGGWVGPDRLVGAVVPLHAPHTVEVDADLTAGTVALTWHTGPLGGLGLARRV